MTNDTTVQEEVERLLKELESLRIGNADSRSSAISARDTALREIIEQRTRDRARIEELERIEELKWELEQLERKLPRASDA